MKLGIIVAAGVLALGTSAFAANTSAKVTCHVEAYTSITWADYNFSSIQPLVTTPPITNNIVVATNVNGHVVLSDSIAPAVKTMYGFALTQPAPADMSWAYTGGKTIPVTISLTPTLSVPAGSDLLLTIIATVVVD